MDIGNSGALRGIMLRAASQPLTGHHQKGAIPGDMAAEGHGRAKAQFIRAQEATATHAPPDLDTAAVLAALRPTEVQTSLLPRVILAPGEQGTLTSSAAAEAASRRAMQGFAAGRDAVAQVQTDGLSLKPTN